MPQAERVHIPPQVAEAAKQVVRVALREVGWLLLALARQWLERQIGPDGGNGETSAEPTAGVEASEAG